MLACNLDERIETDNSLSFHPCSGKLGLRTTNLISLIVFLAGIAIEVSSGTQYGQLVGGRVLTGYGVYVVSQLPLP